MSITHNAFSMSNMSNALQNINFSRPISGLTPPRASYSVTHTRLYELMTSQDMSLFKEEISKLDRVKLRSIASLLTSDSGYFMAIITNKNGSKRVQKLLGKYDDVDEFFYFAILRSFFHVITDRYASYVATRAVLVFEAEKKKLMYEHIFRNTVEIACNKHGCIALNNIIIDEDDDDLRNKLLDFVVVNAVPLSNDVSGNFVIQHVLKLNDLGRTCDVAVSLRGHCVEISFKKFGSYIVERLLERKESMVSVVMELLECDGDRLMRLSRSDFGNFVVAKALRVTVEMYKVDMFIRLVNKLLPFIGFLRKSHGSNIAYILESFI